MATTRGGRWADRSRAFSLACSTYAAAKCLASLAGHLAYGLLLGLVYVLVGPRLRRG